jgi:heme-degrading monooxygenase HmoA
MQTWNIAQINIATAQFPLDDPRLAGFMDQLDAINALADRAPGFVWRLQSDSGNATDIRVGGDDRLIVNMSVWQSAEALSAYVYESAHRGVLARRREWFLVSDAPFQALWWVKAGQPPTVEDGLARLECLRGNGPGPDAFTFKELFPAPELWGRNTYIT